MKRITGIYLTGILFLLTLVLAICSAVSFSQMEFTGDAKMFIGSAAQATFSSLPFPSNVDYAWELKPVGKVILPDF